MAKVEDDLLAGPTDDLLGGAPATKKAASKKSKPKADAAAPAKKAATKKAAAAPKAESAPAKKAPKAKAAPAADRNERGAGKFYFDPDEKAELAKKISKSSKAASTKELAEKFEVETWKVRRAINEILVPEEKGTVEKVGNALMYTPNK